MTEQEKKEYRLESQTYADQVNKLKTHCEQVYELILGQCTQLLKDKPQRREKIYSSRPPHGASWKLTYCNN